MSGESVGQIGLDLVVNKNGFDKQMAGIQGMAKKAGGVLAAAFAVKKMVDFGAQCIKLGSDLQEVQNVVDVTFPKMKSQVDSFAQNAAMSFGLSETMAKRFTGTFGAMAKAFGFNEQAAYEMSTTLSGLSGDVASFYNISQDEAFTKLKSVFTGETESLKDLGIVMTQAALDQYALANGYGKTTQAMSEGEKVALRYKFVTDQLSLASGDFIRTSDGWANQVRLLKLQFDSLKATIGQGLINILTPVIKVINVIISKLMSLANAFRSFTELITGKKGSGGGAKAQTAGMDAVAASADNASGSLGGAGGAAKKAAKDIKGTTTGIDELNIISAPDADSGGSGGGGGSGGYAADDFDMGEVDTSAMDAMDSKYQGLIDKAKELAELFQYGFKIGLGDISVFDDIKTSIDGIKTSLKGIFTDPAVIKSADDFANQLFYNVGKIAGSFVSMGATIADNLLGGINLYLSQNSQRIKDWLVSMFDIGSETATISGRFADATADIFSVFRSDTAKQITADIVSVFSNGFMGATELAASFGRDVLALITAPITENVEGFKTGLSGINEAVQTITSAIAETFQGFVDGVLNLYDEHIHPLLESLKDGFSEIAKKVLEAFNTYILPVIQDAADRFSEFCTSTLQPLIDKFLEFAGKVMDCIKELWESVLMPFITWFIDNIAPIIASNLQIVIDAFFTFLDGISETLGYVIDALSGLLDFVVGVFTGDWDRAWEGIKQFFSSIWDAMKSLVTTVFDAISLFIDTKLFAIRTAWELIWNTVKQHFSDIWENIKETASSIVTDIHTKITTTIETIRAALEEKLNAIKVKWDEIWGGVKTSVVTIFDGMWTAIKGTINSIIGGVEGMANGVVRAINKMIDALNGVSFDIPDWIPGDLGGKSFGLDIATIGEVSIPRLAQGGFVKANTPQLAMIGDNRHYGEIVAPEDKMQDMIDRAVSMATQNGSMSDRYLAVTIDLLRKIVDLIEAMDLTVSIDIREIKKKLVDLDKRSGYTLKTT